MKQHILDKHSSQQTLMPKKHKDRTVKQKLMGNVKACDIVTDFEVDALSTKMRLCPTCNEYIIERKMNTHLDDHEPRNFTCELCGRSLKSLHGHVCKSNYNRRTNYQRKNSKKIVEKPVQCEKCGKELPNARHLKRHLVSHYSIKPHQCPECGMGFSQTSNLKIHMRVHSGDKPYKCDICTEAYAHKVSLKTHKKKKHGIDMWADKPEETT